MGGSFIDIGIPVGVVVFLHFVRIRANWSELDRTDDQHHHEGIFLLYQREKFVIVTQLILLCQR